MAVKKIDRRVARTRATLHRALMSLILRRGYEALTIADICAAADVGRSTFYSHYENKDALLRSGLDDLRDMLVGRQRDARAAREDQSLGFTLAMFEHARGHWDFHRALAGASPIVLDAIRRILSDLVRDDLAATLDRQAESAVPRELIVQYVVGAYMAVVTWWMEGGAKLPAEQVDSIFRQLVTEGIIHSHADLLQGS